MLGELSPEEIEEVLRSEITGRIGCHADGRTYVVPITYGYQRSYVYCHSPEGLKLRMMTEMKTASNPHPMKGMLHVGYDAGSKQYVQIWIDNFGSHAMQMSPGWQGDTLTYTGEQDVMGEKATAKDTLTKKGANQFWHKFELTMKGETHTIVEETCKKK